MRILIVCLALLVIGCSCSILDETITKCQNLCSNNDGVSYMYNDGFEVNCNCNNGATFKHINQ